ncbi:hypothetical protein SLEP1_g555 [Rubroshorea leprosula]|uniref:Uncharacterized protein n=1 Tax=Rubroshorea leprosula TaxID=152421 RepID=A0AAV5HLT0_9ROSI|nr:hypothetical protein SLEP1_g555 [Rubroshorea leprosula]
MAEFGRTKTKRVTGLLDDKARARLVGVEAVEPSYVSGGSEHSGEEFPCLSELVHSFFEEDHRGKSTGYDSDSDRVDSVHDCSEALEVILRSTSLGNRDSYRGSLLAQVLKAIEVLSCFKTDKTVFNRKIAAFLRELGYNAAICKTEWSSSGGLAAGNYEFIDVIQSISVASQNRYFIDIDFASQFEIARPTSEYSRLLQSLPRVFVGKTDELKKIVKVMSNSAMNSLKSRELSLPPWRKNGYMQNKWLGPYRRVVNQIAANSSTPAIPPVNTVNCRYVGFDDALNGRLFVRTR